MSHGLKWRAILVGASAIIGVLLLLPSIPGVDLELPKFLKDRKLVLGLDLQGGMHLTLEVQTEKAVENAIQRTADELKRNFRDEAVRHRSVEAVNSQIKLVVRDDSLDKVNEILSSEYPLLTRADQSQTDRWITLTLEFNPTEVQRIERYAVEQGIETIRNRIDQFGVSEPSIVGQGKRRILIQLPGLKDSEQAIKLIEKTALLEFRLVEQGMSAAEAKEKGLPPGSEILYEHQKDEVSRAVIGKTPYLLQKRALMTGDVITDARVEIDRQYNEPVVTLEFDNTGKKIFGAITSENVGRNMAIILDGVVQSAPVIREPITGGKARISGRFTDQEAKNLVIALRSGSLPAPVKILERREVGPSLGQDSIKAGLLSLALGGALVVLFMLAYYKGSGAIADFALVLNVVLILAALALCRATLTLPGIAGIVLTVGMAVDANVLIFERIREELRLGKTAINALESGYAKALVTILDANVTTFFAAAVLWQFGTGPIKGFAVTLSIGIAASLFTAIVGTRVLFDMILSNKSVRRLSI